MTKTCLMISWSIGGEKRREKGKKKKSCVQSLQSIKWITRQRRNLPCSLSSPILLAQSHATFFFDSRKKTENARRWRQRRFVHKRTSAFLAHTQSDEPVILTIFLSFIAAVKKVTQLSPVYRQNARVFFTLNDFPSSYAFCQLFFSVFRTFLFCASLTRKFFFMKTHGKLDKKIHDKKLKRFARILHSFFYNEKTHSSPVVA